MSQMATEIDRHSVAAHTVHSLYPATSVPYQPAMAAKNPLKTAVEIVEDRLYFISLKGRPSQDISYRRDSDGTKRQIHYFCIDHELVYWNFFLDFGPLNLGQLYRFCTKLNQKLMTLPNHIICFYCNNAPAKRANAVCLVCCWQLLYLNRSPEEAMNGFRAAIANTAQFPFPEAENASAPPLTKRANPTISPLPLFHDASPCACNYQLTILDCLRGLAKARSYGFFDFDNFDVQEYEHFEQVENGDLNWIMYGKCLAFAGPSYEKRVSPEGYCTLAPADYIPYFKSKKVSLVVRLNKKAYHEEDFIKSGIDHMQQFYTDGSCPTLAILDRVVESFEQVQDDEAFAVHCKAGLGRTGTCIGAYIMKHYRFTASEVIAWMRICRPGMVIGPQQQFLKDIEQRMWQLGAVQGSVRAGKHLCSKFAFNCIGDTASTDDNTTNDDPNDEAVVGRAGQADGLLSARFRNRNGKPRKATPPPTPESLRLKSGSSSELFVVTPDPPGKSKCDPRWYI